MAQRGVGWVLFGVGILLLDLASCSASDSTRSTAAGGTSGAGGSPDAGNLCGTCLGKTYLRCDNVIEECPVACTPGEGCTLCSATGTTCVGSEVHECDAAGNAGSLVQACDTANGEICDQGACKNGCLVSEQEPTNEGCEFWAVDLDMADLPTNPAATEWGLAIANAGQAPAHVTIERNDAPVGMPPVTAITWQGDVIPGDLAPVVMPTREVDCGAFPNDHMAPGSCLSSNAFRVTSTAPIVVYQFNNLVHGFSTDASLLIPTTSLGTKYRVVGWPAAHSYPSPGAFVERSYVTVVGTQAGTRVRVYPYWRVRGNPPIPATARGQIIEMQLGPFDVLNLESDDATFNECFQMMDPPYCADMTGSVVDADKPVVVFSGTEASGVGLPEGAPTYTGWDEQGDGCCLQHLEEQLFPMEALGKRFVVTRSPIRSTFHYEEPDVLRFVGAAEVAQVTTNLPPPYDNFTLNPGQVKETWTQKDLVVTSTAPIMVGQFLIAQGYISGSPKGDPSFTLFPPVEQARQNYVFLSPAGWKENYVVIATQVGVTVTVDGSVPTDCEVAPAGSLDGKDYEARRCPIAAGVHRLNGDAPFGITAYGYADADTYSFAGGAAVRKIYEPPIVQ